MKYPVKYSFLIFIVLIISSCKTQEIYKVNKNGDVSVDLTVVVDPVNNKKTQKLGALLVLESSLDEVVAELNKARWNVDVKWLSQRAPYKLQMKLEGNIYKVKEATKFYKFTSVGDNVYKFVLNGNSAENLFDVNIVDRTYTFKSTLFSGVEYYDVNGDKLKQGTEYSRMDAAYVFLESDLKILSEIKDSATVRNKAKLLASKTITDYVNEHFPICNGSRYMISPSGYSEKVLSEIKNAGIFTTSQYLNKADELNGTIWKGAISLVGDVSRDLRSLENGWSEWSENKITYVRLDVQVKNEGGIDKVIYDVKNNYWDAKEKKWSLQELDCRGVEDVAGAPALNKLGLKYLNDHDYKSSLAWFIRSAEEGYPLADYYIGYLYENGLGVKESVAKALFWYKKAAENDSSIAQNHLGNIYSQGVGVTLSYDEAYSWYKKAAEQGNALAQGRLGFLYANGLGVQKSEKPAFFWYKKSAEQGNALAQSWLARSYQNGVGAAKDEKLAALWNSRAEAQGFKDVSEKYSNINKDLTLENRKLSVSSINIAKANKQLEITNSQLEKDNAKAALINKQLVISNRKLIDENKRLIQLSNKLANDNKRLARSAAPASKLSKIPVAVKKPAQVMRTNQPSVTAAPVAAAQSSEAGKISGVSKPVNTPGEGAQPAGTSSNVSPIVKGQASTLKVGEQVINQ